MSESLPPSASTHRAYPAYPELSWHAVFTGWVLGIVISVSIGFAALKLGFSIEGSELAAILGFGILRGLFGRKSIVENNVAQTVASAVNGASSGIMFSVPAIFLLGHQDQLNPALLAFGCIAGAFLGIAFIVPLRKQMIDFERLTYPGGVAVATILKSPGAGVRKAQLLVGAAVVSGGIHALSLGAGVDNWALGQWLGLPSYLNATWYLSLMTVGVGFIAGRGGIAFILGGFVVWWILSPLLAATGAFPLDEAGAVIDTPDGLRGLVYRPLGIGMLIGGAIMGVLLALPLIRSAIKSMSDASKAGTGAGEELPVKLLYVGIAGATVLLTFMAVNSVETVGLGRGIAMAVLGTLWIWMSGIILSEAIGRTNWSPLSGMTLIAVTLLLLIVSGLDDADAIVAAVMVGGATCVAMSQATDLMLDMKTGYLVGATPRRQQMAQFVGAWLGPIVVIGVVYVLHDVYVLGSDALPAPQGQALASTVEGILGGDVPTEKYVAGALMGALLTASQGGLGILVGLGFYLPFNVVLTYAIGTALRLSANRWKGSDWADHTGVPIAAGFIIGEALVGVGYALTMIAQGA
ncbi:OPT/YSL family transporter [Rhodothalassium salexigens]|uniref:OPT/YSL family transporter n=1 Tax=Rhodothalassium salexigens TaxID=1086 RepID=UPI00191225F5